MGCLEAEQVRALVAKAPASGGKVARRVRVLSEVVGVEWWATAAVVEARDTVAAASVVAVETVGVAGVAQVEGCTIRNSCTHSADNANYERAHHTTIRMLSSADRAHQRENIRGAVVQVGVGATARAGMMAPVRVAGPSGGKRALVEKAKAATAEVPVVAVVRTVTAVESGGAVVILALVVGGVAVVRWVAESVAAAASVADSVAAAASVATVVEAAAAAI